MLNQFIAKRQIRPVVFNRNGQLLIFREKGKDEWRLPEGEFTDSVGTEAEISDRARELARSQTGVPIEYVGKPLVPFNEMSIIENTEEAQINQITVVPMLGEGDVLMPDNLEAGWILVRDADVLPNMEERIKEVHNVMYEKGLFNTNPVSIDFTTNKVIGTSN